VHHPQQVTGVEIRPGGARLPGAGDEVVAHLMQRAMTDDEDVALLAERGTGSTYLTGVLAPLILLGTGGGLTFVPLSSSILSTVPQSLAGSASATLQAVQYSGTALGVAVMVALFSAAQRGGAALAPAIGHAITGALALEVSVLVLAASRLRSDRRPVAVLPAQRE